MTMRSRIYLEWARVMSQSTMTSQEVKAMVAAGSEYDDALKTFDAAVREKPDSKTEISEAFHALLAEHKALQAFDGVSTF
jgi:hypothetical protein